MSDMPPVSLEELRTLLGRYGQVTNDDSDDDDYVENNNNNYDDNDEPGPPAGLVGPAGRGQEGGAEERHPGGRPGRDEGDVGQDGRGQGQGEGQGNDT